ncbi:MAG TPA: hypothetical protein VEK38_04700, partial [Candidatus Bathyarchaeia archaeon]|nr:hypothetical protein [Candidatus Bathyarchaeia archaeon]
MIIDSIKFLPNVLLLVFCLIFVPVHAQETETQESDAVELVDTEKNESVTHKETRFISPIPAMMRFSYNNEDLVNIINYIAGQKGVNIILPIGAQALNVKVTLTMEEDITLDEAWSLIVTILEIAGYVIVQHDTVFVVAKKDQYLTRNAYPLYIGTAVQDLPSTDEYIRYLHYFANMKITEDADNQVLKILQDLLPVAPHTIV